MLSKTFTKFIFHDSQKYSIASKLAFIHYRIFAVDIEIGHNIVDSNGQEWTQTVESRSHKCNPIRLWKVIKYLNRKRA